MESRAESIAMALNMRANHIETGNVIMSKRDAAQQLQSLNRQERYRGNDYDRERRVLTGMVTAAGLLTPEQEALVLMLRRYATEIEKES